MNHHQQPPPPHSHHSYISLGFCTSIKKKNIKLDVVMMTILLLMMMLGITTIHATWEENNNNSLSEPSIEPSNHSTTTTTMSAPQKRTIPKVILRTKEEHHERMHQQYHHPHHPHQQQQRKGKSSFYTQPYSKFIQWHHCYSTADDEEDDGISLVTAHLTIIPTRYNVPGVRVDMNMKFNMHVSDTNVLFYQLELWHEETGQTIKYKGPYDVCCGSFIHNDSIDHVDIKKSDLEYGCSLEESNCPILNLNKTYHAQIERPLYVTEKGTYEASVKIYKHRVLESDPSRTEKYEYLCVDIPFKVNFEKEMLNTALWKQSKDGELSLTTMTTTTQTTTITPDTESFTSTTSSNLSDKPLIKDEM
nr:unnamed protein product [Naegleria fowleri]